MRSFAQLLHSKPQLPFIVGELADDKTRKDHRSSGSGSGRRSRPIRSWATSAQPEAYHTATAVWRASARATNQMTTGCSSHARPLRKAGQAMNSIRAVKPGSPDSLFPSFGKPSSATREPGTETPRHSRRHRVRPRPQLADPFAHFDMELSSRWRSSLEAAHRRACCRHATKLRQVRPRTIERVFAASHRSSAFGMPVIMPAVRFIASRGSTNIGASTTRTINTGRKVSPDDTKLLHRRPHYHLARSDRKAVHQRGRRMLGPSDSGVCHENAR